MLFIRGSQVLQYFINMKRGFMVSLFNGISTFCRLFKAKAILLEEQ